SHHTCSDVPSAGAPVRVRGRRDRRVVPAPRRMPGFFLPDPPPRPRYTLSLHDALPIFPAPCNHFQAIYREGPERKNGQDEFALRSEEHTSELQSRENLVCRLLLEKKKARDARAQAIHDRCSCGGEGFIHDSARRRLYSC